MAPAIMLLRIVIRINIVRCISVNKIEITVLSARVLDALSGRGLKAKTVHEFERYGTRRIVKHCLGKGQILYSKETVQNFVWQERAKQESGTLPHYQWGITRRAAVYLDQMAEYGKIQDEPIRPWEAEHNPLFQAISCNPSNSMKVIDIICRTRDAVMQLELSDKTKTNYIYPSSVFDTNPSAWRSAIYCSSSILAVMQKPPTFHKIMRICAGREDLLLCSLWLFWDWNGREY